MYIKTFTKILILFLFILLPGCLANKPNEVVIPAVTAEVLSTTASSTKVIADVVIIPSQFGQTIELALGQTFVITSPSPDKKWRVDYDPDLFEPLLPQDLYLGSSEGWVFKAVAQGDGQVILNSIEDCANPPCPIMPVNIQLYLQVK